MKLMGIVLVIVACGALGFLIASNYRRRPYQLRQLQGAFQMLETQIYYGSTPLPEALLAVAKNCNKAISPLFKIAGNCLLAREGITAYEAWEKALEHMFMDTALNNVDKDILLQYGMNLGNSDREEQLKHLRLLQAQLKDEEQKSMVEKDKNERLWKYGGVLTGLLLVILLS